MALVGLNSQASTSLPMVIYAQQSEYCTAHNNATLLTISMNKSQDRPQLCKNHPGNIRQGWMGKHNTITCINTERGFHSF